MTKRAAELRFSGWERFPGTNKWGYAIYLILQSRVLIITIFTCYPFLYFSLV